MNWFRNMKIRQKMLVSFMLVIALIMTMVVLAVKEIMDVGDRYATVLEHPIALRSVLQTFQAEFRNLRRIGATIAIDAGMDDQIYELLFKESAASYNQAIARLDEAKNIVSTNPELTQAEKDERISNNNELRLRFNRFYNEVITPLIEASRTHDRNTQLRLVGSAESLARPVREKHGEMLVSAMETANTQVQRAKDDAAATIAVLIVISIITALIAIAVSLYVAHYMSKPLAPLTRFMTNVATAGDIAFAPEDIGMMEKFGRNKDELGQVIVAATAFVERILEVGKALAKISSGDLTSGIPLLSNRDSMGFAFEKMLDNLNAMCSNITQSSIQVATGSNQVAAGAQALSAGASEQAASIEELSHAIAAIDERTRNTTQKAGRAARLTNSIKDSAEKSNLKMNELMIAVGEISEASQSIRKIIKTIDEIAFQTNILAVNAAVEAAHAGKYGKGFSVVATEVRSLAAKSAKAAKETELLIANSIEKVELGVHIADETSTSLSEIVSGISDNSQLVSEIARSSEEQSNSISQISIGITQVSQVVQETSATAEESTVASEEMAEQSVILKNLVSQFRLRDDPMFPQQKLLR